jgi:predicted nuclease of predicted toxin-antitoxin system
VRALLLDDMLPAGLAGELRARGRDARSVAELGLSGATDADVLAAADGAVLVTALDDLHAGATVAVVAGHDAATRRDVVHRWAHAIAVQRPGSVRRYR